MKIHIFLTFLKLINCTVILIHVRNTKTKFVDLTLVNFFVIALFCLLAAFFQQGFSARFAGADELGALAFFRVDIVFAIENSGSCSSVEKPLFRRIVCDSKARQLEERLFIRFLLPDGDSPGGESVHLPTFV